ncbi:hypothetical protein [Streptacidiphilus cavernicola]|uniref:WXG100 family type VII secretion target n=1 Tax=Streptacidiphilus cavernicola TaxID=3342716 RepID=A0ABV6W668_9ACTN
MNEAATGGGATEDSYPHLGFNPVPGIPEDVDAIASVLKSAAASLKESGSLLTQVRDAGNDIWQGQAGDAFRSHVDGELTKRLSTAQTSLETALGIFNDWHGDLVGFKSSAAKLDAEAEAAQQAAEQAAAKVVTAQADPAFKLIGQTFSGAALQQAQQAVETAQHGLDAANRADADAKGELDAIIKQARELESQHEAIARRFAQALDHAASDLAPHKPGMFSRMWNDFKSGLSNLGSWVKDHLDAIHSVLSTISAIAGLVALLTPPPIDAIALGVSLVAGAGALAVDAANPEFRKGISDALHGNFDKAARSALGTALGDTLSVVPGLGGVVKGGTAGLKAGIAGVKAARAGEELVEGARVLPKMAAAVHDAAQNPGIAAKLLSKQQWVRPVLEKGGVLAKDATTETYQHTVGVVLKGKNAATHIYKDIRGEG